MFGMLNFCLIFAHTNTKITIIMTTKSLRASIVDMEIGDKIIVPVSEYGYTTIRSYASDLGFAYNRTYSTSRNRAERTYTIIRLS